jgi:hypothetical protein
MRLVRVNPMRRTRSQTSSSAGRAHRAAAQLALAALAALICIASTHRGPAEAIDASTHSRLEVDTASTGLAGALRAHDAAQCALCAIASQSRSAVRAVAPHSALVRVMHLAQNALPGLEPPFPPALTEAPPRAPPAFIA